MRIVVDTREQKPLFTGKKGVLRKALSAGDYSIEGFEDRIALERKSLGDLFGTLGKGHERFKRELERAQSLEYFGIVVEGCFIDVEMKLFDGSHRTKMRGVVVNKILMTLHVKYGIPVWFCRGRDDARLLVRGLLEAWVKMHKSEF